MTIQDKIRGSLIGGAVGDALGYPVEFMSHGMIVDRYGEAYVEWYYGQIGKRKKSFSRCWVGDLPTNFGRLGIIRDKPDYGKRIDNPQGH